MRIGRSVPESCRDVADLLDQSLAVPVDGSEAVMLVEGCCCFIDGVHDHESCGGHFARLHRPAQCIQEKLAAKTLSVQ